MREYTTTELDALAEAFKDWRWNRKSVEPDGRVDLLVDVGGPKAVAHPFLCRFRDGWFWVSDANHLRDMAESRSPFTWQELISELGTDEKLRVALAEELVAGGWTVTDTSNQETTQVDPEVVDEAKAQLDRGLDLMETPGIDLRTLNRVETHLMASIAISLYELVALHKKYAPEELRVEVDTGPSQEQEVRAAADNIGEPAEPFPAVGPVVDEKFPWAQ